MSDRDLEKQNNKAEAPTADAKETKEVNADKAEAEKVSAPADMKKNNTPPATKNAAVSGSAVDDVQLSQCVYKNTYSRKSLTVHHVQRRLVEWGYRDAGADKDGWYGDLTMSAVAAFQKANGLDGAGMMNAATLEALFKGDDNVRIVS